MSQENKSKMNVLYPKVQCIDKKILTDDIVQKNQWKDSGSRFEAISSTRPHKYTIFQVSGTRLKAGRLMNLKSDPVNTKGPIITHQIPVKGAEIEEEGGHKRVKVEYKYCFQNCTELKAK